MTTPPLPTARERLRAAPVVPSDDELLLQRCAVLMDVLAEAQSEMAVALGGRDIATAKACARRLGSVGWLFREASVKHSLGAL